MKTIIIFLTLTIIILISGCGKERPTEPNTPSIDANNNGFESYEVAKIFVDNCSGSGCHSGSTPAHNLSLMSWSEMIKGAKGRNVDTSGAHHKISASDDVYGGEAVIPFNSKRSLLYRLISGDVADSLRMPLGKNPLSENQIATIKNWIDNGARSNSGKLPSEISANDIFITNQAGDEVSVIDSDLKIVKRIISVDLNASFIDLPDHLARKNGFLYVGLVGANRLLKIDILTNQIVAQTTNIESPGMIVFSSDAKKAFVSKSPLAAGSNTGVYIIDTETMTRTGEIILPAAGVPHALAITPSGLLAIADMTRDVIYLYNTITNDYEDIINIQPGPFPHGPIHAYTTFDGKYLFVSCRYSNFVIVYDLTTKQEFARVPLGDHPMQIAITKDGTKAYVAIFHDAKVKVLKKAGSVWFVDAVISHDAMRDVWGIDLTPDEKYIIAVSSNEEDTYKPRYKPKSKTRISNVVFINASTLEVKKIIDVDSYASGVNAR